MLKESTETKEFWPAFLKAQKAIKPALKDKANPHFKSKYADLANVMEACMDALNDNGLAVAQSCSSDQGAVLVTTRIVHASSAQWIEDTMIFKPAQDTPQGYGSCVTYGRRYMLQTMAGVPTEDDDGNAASQRPAPQQVPARPADKPKESQPKGDAISAMLQAFSELKDNGFPDGVGREILEQLLGTKLENINQKQVVFLREALQQGRTGKTPLRDIFGGRSKVQELNDQFK